MAGLDPATQQASVGERKEAGGFLQFRQTFVDSFRRADARRLGGRVKPGHGE